MPTRARSTSYSALLRGINLGSHKRVRMADLRELAEDLGCADVRTYVQSGNVVFRSDRSAADLTKAIEKGIEKQLGLDVIVVIRTERQLRNLVANNPFVRAKIRPNTLYVAFLAEKPDPKRLRQLGDRDFVPERWEIVAGDKNAEPSHRDWRRCEIADRQETEHKQFAAPDEVREFPNGRAEILRIGGGEVGRLVFEPGWRWSTDVKPIAHTESCEAPYFQYHVSGQLAIRMDDGTEMIAGPGDITSLPEGHDAWVVGDEPAIVVDWYGSSNYAKG